MLSARGQIRRRLRLICWASSYVDHDRTEDFLAFDGDTLIATAMLAADPEMERAEVAISIRADYKHRGIGWALLDHVARLPRLAVEEQADLDEVAVPAVHLVEASAGHHVRTRQVEEAGVGRLPVRGQRAQLDGGQVRRRHRGPELGLHARAVLGGGQVDGPALSRRALELGIGRGLGQVARPDHRQRQLAQRTPLRRRRVDLPDELLERDLDHTSILP